MQDKQLTKKSFNFIILLIVFIAFITLDWHANSFHGNGLATIGRILKGAVQPDLSLLPKAIDAAWITLAYAAAGLSIAIVLGFALSLVASGILLEKHQKKAENLLAFMRAIHELVWALFFVASIGLKPLTAVWAIAIPYGGMLGKVYTNILRDVAPEKIQALQSLGANRLQIVIFGYLPECYNHFVSYTLYRFECAIRSSSILSFVGLPGLGMKIQLALNDLKYEETFLYIYMLILVIVLTDAWGNLHRKYHHKDRYSGKVFALILLSTWWYVGIYEGAFFEQLLTAKNMHYSLQFIKGLIGIGNASPAFFQWPEIKTVLKLGLETLQMSILAISFASVGMLLTVTMATRQYGHKFFFMIMRASYLFTRAIPELIWAMLIIFIIKPGILAGAIALSIHNYGILSKLCAEVIEDLDEAPLVNLTQVGATRWQLLWFGVYPSAFKKMFHFIIYRWEVILRTTLIVGFIGAGGLGQYFKLHLSLFHYTHVTLVLIVYFILVKFSDFLSAKLHTI